MSTKVKQEAARIDDLIKANAAAARGEQPTPPADDAPASESAVETQQGDDQQAADVVDFTPGQTPPNDDQPAVTTENSDDSVEKLRQEAERWEQRWRSLDGQLRSKDEQIDRLTEMVSRMADATSSRQTEPQEPAKPSGVLNTDSDNFGEDMVEFVQRVARGIVQSEIAAVSQAVQNLQQELSTTSQNVAVAVNETFESQLTRLAPKWQEFDRDDGFHAWLNESDTRLNMFTTAAKNKDAPTVAEFFNLYISKRQAEQASVEGAASGRKSKLEKQVSPGKSRSTATPASTAPTNERIWTRTEIANAYNSKRRGEFTKEEWAALEKEIERAQRDGRVDYNK